MGCAQMMTIADDRMATWVTAAAASFAEEEDGTDYSTSVIITIEPTPAEKQALAVPGGVPADQIHCTLAFLLGTVDELGDAGRQTISTVLAQFGAQFGGLAGTVSGLGWFGSPDSITLALVDVPGLAAFRSAIAEALAVAGTPLNETYDFQPHITLAQTGAVDAADRVGQQLTFNELRCRWGTDVLAFDLMGIPQAPEAPPVESPEVAPVSDETPIPEVPPTPQEAAVADYEIVEDHPECQGSPDGSVGVVEAKTGMLVSCHMSAADAQSMVDDMNATQAPMAPATPGPTTPVGGLAVSPRVQADITAALARRRAERESAFDTLPIDGVAPAPTPALPVPSPGSDETMEEEPPVDISTIPDDALTIELARRIAAQAVAAETAEGEEPDPESAAAAQGVALTEVTEALAEALEDVSDQIGGIEPPGQDENMEPAAPIAPPVGAPPVAPPMSLNRAARRRAARSGQFAGGVAAPPQNVGTADPNTGTTCPNCNEMVPAGASTCPSCGAAMAAAEPGEMGYEYEAILTVEGMQSGDGRFISEGCLTWRDLPLPLMLQTVNAPGHDGSEFCGWISEIERSGQAIVGRGNFAATPAGVRAREILSDKASAGKFGVSVDIDTVKTVFASPEGAEMSPEDALERKMSGKGDIIEMMVGGRIMGATMTPFPAFQEAYVYLLTTNEDAALVASAVGEIWRSTVRAQFTLDGAAPTEALVASAAGPDPEAPPSAWFQAKPMDAPEPFTVFPDGRCYGLVAQWGTCHIGNSRKCVGVPKSNDFRSFYTGKTIVTREGEQLAVGPIIMDTVHPNLLWDASDAQAFYAHTGCAVADVRLYTNEWGIVAAGAVRPDATATQVRRLRASDVSPDWRVIEGQHKLVSLLGVNTSGFLVEGIAASAGNFRPWGIWDSETQEVGALVAAGALHRDAGELPSPRVSEVLAAQQAQIDELRGTVAQLAQLATSNTGAAERRARTAAAMSKMGIEDCGCGETLAAEPTTDPSRFVDDGLGLIIAAR